MNKDYILLNFSFIYISIDEEILLEDKTIVKLLRLIKLHKESDNDLTPSSTILLEIELIERHLRFINLDKHLENIVI